MPENDPTRLCSIIDPLLKLLLRGAQRRGNRQLTDSDLRDCHSEGLPQQLVRDGDVDHLRWLAQRFQTGIEGLAGWIATIDCPTAQVHQLPHSPLSQLGNAALVVSRCIWPANSRCTVFRRHCDVNFPVPVWV